MHGWKMADLNGSPFCRGLSGLATPDDLGSSLLFATDEQLELLKQATHIYFDATFKVAPALYYQLFTVFVPYADTAFPGFYALMPRKTQSAYRAIFQKLKDLKSESRSLHHHLLWLISKRHRLLLSVQSTATYTCRGVGSTVARL